LQSPLEDVTQLVLEVRFKKLAQRLVLPARRMSQDGVDRKHCGLSEQTRILGDQAKSTYNMYDSCLRSHGGGNPRCTIDVGRQDVLVSRLRSF